MKKILEDHLGEMRKKGIIDQSTTVHDFIDNFQAAHYDVRNHYSEMCLNEFPTPSVEMVRAVAEMVLAGTDFIQFYKFDIEGTLKKR